MVSTSDSELRHVVASFVRPSYWKGGFQLLTSLGPCLVVWAAAYLVFPISPLLGLALALIVGVLLVRVFIVQHDCGHGSFFASMRANAIVGRLCSVMTLTPFTNWARQHSMHHSNWNNLDRRKGNDFYSSCLTVREYKALTRRGRLLYRLPRHPLIANLVLPPLVFLVLYRLPFDTPRKWKRERRSVWLTNAAILAVFGALVVMVGWREVLQVQLSIAIVSSILGVWLFSLQHRFETTHWTNKADWNASSASMRGSSWFALPRPLHWLTGNIGFHHIHHLNPRVPNYRLGSAHEAVQERCVVPPLSLLGGLRAPWLTLWDEASGRLVSFRDADKR